MIYWAMLQAANADCLEEQDRLELLSMAERLYDFYEADWDSAIGGYRSTRGIPYALDGIMMPFNQQNAFGLCLIELWKATGNERYAHRVTELAESFVKEIEVTEDGRAIWHYWPAAFYDGWTEADDLSDNTPSREPAEEISYEDSSHAAINATFLLECAETFGNAVVSETVVQGVRQLAESLSTDNGLSNVIYPANSDATSIHGFWARAMEEPKENNLFAAQATLTDIYAGVEFDSQTRLYAFANLLNYAQGGTLSVCSKQYSVEDGWQDSTTTIPFAEIAEYAKTLGLNGV